MNILSISISELLEKTESFDWATIIAAGIGTLSLLIGYIIQKNIDRNSKNRENSKEAYLKFLNDFSDTTVEDVIYDDYYQGLPRLERKKKEIESLRKKLHSRNLLLLHGSDNVVNAYLNYIKHIDDIRQHQVVDQQENYFNILISAMRREAYPKTEISNEDIRNYFNEFNRQ